MTKESMQKIFEEICATQLDDNTEFEITKLSDIREGAEYPSIRISMWGKCQQIKVPLSVDISTGDPFFPDEIEYEFPKMFEEDKIHMTAYTIEAILAEKIETILSRGITNTRIRDFYDVYVFYRLHQNEYDNALLRQSLEQTAEYRNSQDALKNWQNIIDELRANQQLHHLWKRYQANFEYAKNISFEDTCNAVRDILQELQA